MILTRRRLVTAAGASAAALAVLAQAGAFKIGMILTAPDCS